MPAGRRCHLYDPLHANIGHQYGPLAVDQDVGRFEITVHYTHLVRVV
jgi:hypothetical protein